MQIKMKKLYNNIKVWIKENLFETVMIIIFIIIQIYLQYKRLKKG